MTPTAALARYNRVLSKYERNEILNYPQVYFVGPTAAKIRADPSKQGNNCGYDNDKGRYKVVKNDHIGYRYEVLSALGKGSFGDVVKVFDHKKKCHVALKIIRNEKRFHDQAKEELKILEAVRRKDRHDKHNVIHMKDHFLFRNHLCITFEILANDLYAELKKNGFKGFGIDRVRTCAVNLVQCLRNLRRSRIIHCDLKPENILRRSHGGEGLKVIDFGSSCLASERIHTYIQSRFYRAPEIVLGGDYGMPIDMWSLGCILCELHTGRPLFPALSEIELMLMHIEYLGTPSTELLQGCTRAHKYFDSKGRFRRVVDSKGRTRHVKSKDLKTLLGSSNKHFLDFVERCLTWDPALRMTPREASRHPFLTGLVPTTAASMTTTASVTTAKPSTASDSTTTTTATTTTGAGSAVVTTPEMQRRQSAPALGGTSSRLAARAVSDSNMDTHESTSQELSRNAELETGGTHFLRDTQRQSKIFASGTSGAGVVKHASPRMSSLDQPRQLQVIFEKYA